MELSASGNLLLPAADQTAIPSRPALRDGRERPVLFFYGDFSKAAKKRALGYCG
jgi:hypothetical protein